MEVNVFYVSMGYLLEKKNNIMVPIERSPSHVDSAYEGPFECKIFFAKIVQEHLKLK